MGLSVGLLERPYNRAAGFPSNDLGENKKGALPFYGPNLKATAVISAKFYWVHDCDPVRVGGDSEHEHTRVTDTALGTGCLRGMDGETEAHGPSEQRLDPRFPRSEPSNLPPASPSFWEMNPLAVKPRSGPPAGWRGG